MKSHNIWSLGTRSFHLAYVFKIHSHHRPYQYFISFCYQMISHSMDTLHFIYPFISWWTFGLFHFLAVRNIGVHVYLCTYIFISLEVGLMDYVVTLCLFFHGNAWLSSEVAVPFFIPISNEWLFTALHSHKHLISSTLWVLVILTGIYGISLYF